MLRIHQQYLNFVQSQGVVRPSANLTRWLDDNDAWLEQQINERHPKPRWARKLGEVDEKGLRFMRKDGES